MLVTSVFHINMRLSIWWIFASIPFKKILHHFLKLLYIINGTAMVKQTTWVASWIKTCWLIKWNSSNTVSTFYTMMDGQTYSIPLKILFCGDKKKKILLCFPPLFSKAFFQRLVKTYNWVVMDYLLRTQVSWLLVGWLYWSLTPL